MAHKKAAGSAKNLRDSNAKYRWVKIFGAQPAVAGNIIIRQKGDKYELGENTYKGRDFSIHALVDGIVAFKKKKIVRFDGRKYLKTVVYVTTDTATTEVEAPVKEAKATKTLKAKTPKDTDATATAKPKAAAKAPKAKSEVATPVEEAEEVTA